MSADYTRLLDYLRRIFMHVEFKTDRREVVPGSACDGRSNQHIGTTTSHVSR
jgi:hypothetical protein